MMIRRFLLFPPTAVFPFSISIFLLCLSIFPPPADAALTITVRDHAGNPAPSVSVQIFPGILDPDSDAEPISPPKPRTDGLVGFVTSLQGHVSVDLPAGPYSVVAFSGDSGTVKERFLIVREASAPGEVTLSMAEIVTVTVQAIGESNFSTESTPLVGARVSFRPSQRILGFVGLLNNDGQLQASISPGRYHVVITGSIAGHYVVLTNQAVGGGC